MPIPIRIKSPYEEALIIQRELDFTVDEQLAIVAQHVPSLNSDQLTVFTSIMAAVNDSELYPKMFSVDGPGGTGKHSFIIHFWLEFAHRVKLPLD